MKNISIAILILLVIGAWACQSEPNITDTPAEHQPIPVDDSGEDMTIEDCRVRVITRSEREIMHEIEDSCAIRFIDDYKDYANTIKETLLISHPATFPKIEERMVYGVNVDRSILLEMLLKSSPRDSFFIMMGLMPNDSTGLILTVKSDSTNQWQYFDFTYPCPTACPSFLDFSSTR